jgi:hypothetical protein
MSWFNLFKPVGKEVRMLQKIPSLGGRGRSCCEFSKAPSPGMLSYEVS